MVEVDCGFDGSFVDFLFVGFSFFFKEYDKRRLWPRESLVAISLSWRECSSLISKRFYVVKGICFLVFVVGVLVSGLAGA